MRLDVPGVRAPPRTNSPAAVRSIPIAPEFRVRPVVSCEHAGNRVPDRYRALLEDAEAALESHRGWDPGALGLARGIARRLAAPLHYCRTTRLLVDTNRSEESDELFSRFTRDLPSAERRRLLERIHRPYRERVRAEIRAAHPGQVLHLSVHTFSPVWRGRWRGVGVGVLFDPTREAEAVFSHSWIRGLRRRFPELVIRANEPYRGVADGLTSAFRLEFAPTRYLGIELEVRQDLLLRVDSAVPVRRGIIDTIEPVLAGVGSGNGSGD